ncbi:MAG TPA: TspO/MBR family protein [Planctomycetota bacterium]|nr:TspO/MBR family protein [Planctomycetota bacterium]
MKTREQVVGLVVIVVIVAAAPALGAWTTAEATRTWYQEINRPAWTPPNWLFGPVWTTLYALMALSAWLVWREKGFAARRGPLTLFIVQLALNAAWTPLFFGMRWFGVAFVEIVVMWAAIVATTVAFFRVHTAAGWLLVPYLVWVSYASTLSGGIWWLNR